MVFTTNGKVLYTEQDSIIFEKYISKLNVDKGLPINDLIVKTALFFRDTPYIAGTLENNESEQLVINLRQLDCSTFVENCIALSRTLKSKDHSFSNFCKELKTIRYRDGKIEDYSSRLHYSTDWIYNNSQKKILTDNTEAIGGMQETKLINFMSTHTDAYVKLKNNLDLQQKISFREKEINKRDAYYVLRKNNISKTDNLIKNGDIITFATSIDGLDYSHMGIAYHYNGRLTFIHASSRAMKVIIEPQSLSTYCSKSTRCTGISISRCVDLVK